MIRKLLFLAILAGVFSAPAKARDGHPDPDFAQSGIAELAIPGSNAFVAVRAMAIDNQGRVLVVGKFNGRGFVLRLLSSGHMDTSFANGGWFVMPSIAALNLGADAQTIFAAIALHQSTIYAAGYPKNGAYKTCALVVALTDAGTLKPGFGTDGSGALCGPDGLQLGEANLSNAHNPRIGLVVTDQQLLVTVVRLYGDLYFYPKAEWLLGLTHAGTIDPAFGNQGLIILSGGFASGGLALDSQGRLVVSGESNYNPEFRRLMLPAGSADTSFGQAGRSTIAYPSFGYYPDILQTWTMLGDRPTIGFRTFKDEWGQLGTWDYGFLRLTAAGSADPDVKKIPDDTSAGFVAHSTLAAKEVNYFFDTAATADRFDRVVIAGPELVRLRSDGNLDSDFANNGYFDLPQPFQYPLGPGVTQAVATDPAGNAFVATSEYGSGTPGQQAFRVIKFVGDTLLESTFE